MIEPGNSDHLKQQGKATGTFYFKQFKVGDGQCTMKVGTDAVLLGSIVDVSDAGKILEIGTGSGVIALILAQRSRARIDAIDIDSKSVLQAGENIKKSPWAERLKAIHSSLQNFAVRAHNKYDLVVSNPPFFSRSLKSPEEKRNISRHNDSLSFNELLTNSARLMLPGASLWVILPVRESAEFIEEAVSNGFHIHFLMKVFPKEGQCQHRNIIQLKITPAEFIKESSLAIKTSDNCYSREYKEITKEFYIDF